jgi:hypothetical protein
MLALRGFCHTRHMASMLIARRPHPEVMPMPPAGVTPDGLAQHKLTRLLELRAVIDALRCDREAQDPLLAWVTAQERAENS